MSVRSLPGVLVTVGPLIFHLPTPAALVEIGTQRQLFLDDHLIEKMENASRVFNPAKKAKHNPIIRRNRPWEGNYIRVNHVLFDEEGQIFKMWYSSMTMISRQDEKERTDVDVVPGSEIFCYAISEDGFH